MNKYLLLLLFGLSVLNAHAQSKRANVWYFGNHAGIDFNTSPPTALTDGQINTYEGCATICDTTGNLLFYTDGITVWNKQHKQMPNGTGLGGHSSSTQAALIVPQPDNDSLFYIFTTDALGKSNGLQFNIVNINLDSGRGDIISKNIVLQTPVCEKLTATYHANGRDIWVAAHGFGNNKFYVYLITQDGLLNCPVISETGSVHTTTYNSNAQGTMKFSPDGHNLAVTLYNYYVELFKFNSLTGNVSFRDITLDNILLPYGLEFSPNGNILYVTDRGKNIYSYNLLFKDQSLINANRNTILTSNKYIFNNLQIGSDTNVYFAIGDSTFIGIINNPDSFGTNYNLKFLGFDLKGKKVFGGFPNFITSYFNINEPLFNYSISFDTLNIFSSFKSNVFKWLFYKDDILIDSSTLLNPMFPIVDNHIYSVRLIINKTDTFERIASKKLPMVYTNDTSICDKDSILLLSSKNYHCIYWQDTINSNDLWVYKSGVYRVTGVDGYGNVYKDSIKVQLLKTPKLFLGNDTSFCANNTHLLKGDTGYKYLWNTGDTSISITINKSGVYFLTEKKGICETTDTIKIDILTVPKPVVTKLGTSLSVNPVYKNFQWYKNNQIITGAKASQYIVSSFGDYFVIVTDSNGCSGNSDTIGLNTGIQIVEQIDPIIYPNPVLNCLYIEFDSEIKWQLLDVTGNQILAGTKNIIDMNDLKSTLYILKVTSEKKSSIYKIIKQ